MLKSHLILLAPDSAASGAPPTEKPAAPASPASPAPGAAASPSPTDAPEEDVLASLDAAYTKAGAEPAKPSGDTKPAAAPAAAAAPAPKPSEGGQPAKPAIPPKEGPKELRENYEKLKVDFDTYKATTAQLEAKLKKFEAEGKDTTALSALVDQREKEANELRAELRALKQEASPEFKKQYDEPFNQAASWAEDYVNRLAKSDGAKADFQRDFVPLYQLARDTTIGAARAKAEEIFDPRDVPEVMDSVKELVLKNKVRQAAFENEKKGWKEKQDQAEGARVQQRLTQTKQERELFDKVNADIRGAIEGFRVPVDDKELVALQTTGEQQFEAMLARSPKDLSQKLVWGAHVKQRFAAFEANQLTIRRQAARIAELEGKLKDTKPTPPGGGNNRPGGAEVSKPADTTDEWARGAKAAVEAAG